MSEDSMIGRYLAARRKAVALNDARLVVELDFQLARLGYREEQPAAAREAVNVRADNEARPRGRGLARRDGLGRVIPN